MNTFLKYILILLAVIIFQAIVYVGFLRPAILTWGASGREAIEALPGDDLAPCISSTRAITIKAPASDVWKWLVQLGADRGGFYSYTFLERLSGYDTDNTIVIVPEYQSMEVGRIVPGNRSGSGELFKDGWRVLAVDPGQSIVLENWGTFLLRPVNSDQARLIVRTHGWDASIMANRIGWFIMEPLHYLMERRMLMGIRDRAEAGPGVPLPQWPDIAWFVGIVVSGFGVLSCVFLGRGIYKLLLPMVLGALWLITLLIFSPNPVYSIILAAVVITTAGWPVLKKHNKPGLPRYPN